MTLRERLDKVLGRKVHYEGSEYTLKAVGDDFLELLLPGSNEHLVLVPLVTIRQIQIGGAITLLTRLS